jgi:Secretion system C-terminal sorting domain
MKKQLFTIILSAASLITLGQAVNFNCNDCASVSHDLFSELDAGKVIVLDFVMPCGSCISPSLTAYNIVQSYASSNPGRVKLYLCDDVGTTACSSLSSWAATNSISPDAVFSNTSVVESAYGSGGMPKIVVVGGASHTVYFNQYGSAAGNATAITNAINNALNASTGITDASSASPVFNLFPNPAGKLSSLTFTLKEISKVNIEVYDMTGQKVSDVFSGTLSAGVNTIPVSTAKLPNGIYFVKINTADKSQVVRFIVSY